MIDVSELMRPEPKFASKSVIRYRDYSIDHEDPIKERVRITYTDMHTYQTVDYVKSKFKCFHFCTFYIYHMPVLVNWRLDY